MKFFWAREAEITVSTDTLGDVASPKIPPKLYLLFLYQQMRENNHLKLLKLTRMRAATPAGTARAEDPAGTK